MDQCVRASFPGPRSKAHELRLFQLSYTNHVNGKASSQNFTHCLAAVYMAIVRLTDKRKCHSIIRHELHCAFSHHTAGPIQTKCHPAPSMMAHTVLGPSSAHFSALKFLAYTRRTNTCAAFSEVTSIKLMARVLGDDALSAPFQTKCHPAPSMMAHTVLGQSSAHFSALKFLAHTRRTNACAAYSEVTSIKLMARVLGGDALSVPFLVQSSSRALRVCASKATKTFRTRTNNTTPRDGTGVKSFLWKAHGRAAG